MSKDTYSPGMLSATKFKDDGKTISCRSTFGNFVVNKVDITAVSITSASGFLAGGKGHLIITGHGSELANFKDMPIDYAKGIKEWIESRLPEKEAEATIKSTDNDIEVLTKLKKMLEAELITQSEYDTKKAEVLGRM